jgi:hypothetical protein
MGAQAKQQELKNMSENNELVLLQNARTALSKVSTFDDAREIRDKADAVRHYARQAKLGQELVVEAAVLKLRAERRLGEILRETQLATGVEGNQHADIPGEPNGVLLSELGISKSESSRMQRIAELAVPHLKTTSTLKPSRNGNRRQQALCV